MLTTWSVLVPVRAGGGGGREGGINECEERQKGGTCKVKSSLGTRRVEKRGSEMFWGQKAQHERKCGDVNVCGQVSRSTELNRQLIAAEKRWM